MSEIPPLTPEQRHAVASRFSRATQLLAAGSPGQAVPLLLECCRLDPANLTYRQMLRGAARDQQRKQPTPAFAAWLSTWRARRRLRKALQSGHDLETIDLAEGILVVSPTNTEAHWAAATAFERMGWIDQAVVCLEQARLAVQPAKTFDKDLARLYERRGSFTQARQLTEHVAGSELDFLRGDLAIVEEKLQAHPGDAELQGIRARLAHEVQTREISRLQHEADRYPAELTHRFELGKELLKAGRFEAALAAFEQTRADERLRWRSLVYAAYCHINGCKWALAKPLFEEALPLIPPSDRMHQEVRQLLDSQRSSG
jgi:tetratricopeptide (TPR) repeat protein